MFKKNEIQEGDVRVGAKIKAPGIDGVGTVIEINGDDVRVRFEQALEEQISEEEKAKAQEEAARLEELAAGLPKALEALERAGGSVKFGQPKL